MQKKVDRYWPVLATLAVLCIMLRCYSEINFKPRATQEPVMAVASVVDMHTFRVLVHKVSNIRVTYYHATRQQCDDDPTITAAGSKINPLTVGSLRYCALSRDLLVQGGGIFNYGDRIKLEGTGEYDGYWTVKDTMPLYQKKHIDLLFSVGRHGHSSSNAVITKKEWIQDVS